VLDIFSRYFVAWRLEWCESATLAGEMIAQAISREGVDPKRLTIHADGGPSMTSKTLAQFYADLERDQEPVAGACFQRQSV
jgi:putative transposase